MGAGAEEEEEEGKEVENYLHMYVYMEHSQVPHLTYPLILGRIRGFCVPLSAVVRADK